VTYAPYVGLTGADQASLSSALTARGLLGGTQLDSSWAAAGPGNGSVTPGVRVLDNPSKLKGWLVQLTENLGAFAMVPQGIDTGLNSKLDPGELVTLWFDVQNNAAQTAGGVEVTITSLDPEVTFENRAMRDHAVLDSANRVAQVQYGKVNGSAIVTALTSANPTYSVSTGNSYFRTNPYFDSSFTTAVWARVSATAAHGKVVQFQVVAKPTNGAASTVIFPVTIN
jgi:hypothetical protein